MSDSGSQLLSSISGSWVQDMCWALCQEWNLLEINKWNVLNLKLFYQIAYITDSLKNYKGVFQDSVIKRTCVSRSSEPSIWLVECVVGRRALGRKGKRLPSFCTWEWLCGNVRTLAQTRASLEWLLQCTGPTWSLCYCRVDCNDEYHPVGMPRSLLVSGGKDGCQEAASHVRLPQRAFSWCLSVPCGKEVSKQ